MCFLVRSWILVFDCPTYFLLCCSRLIEFLFRCTEHVVDFLSVFNMVRILFTIRIRICIPEYLADLVCSSLDVRKNTLVVARSQSYFSRVCFLWLNAPLIWWFLYLALCKASLSVVGSLLMCASVRRVDLCVWVLLWNFIMSGGGVYIHSVWLDFLYTVWCKLPVHVFSYESTSRKAKALSCSISIVYRKLLRMLLRCSWKLCWLFLPCGHTSKTSSSLTQRRRRWDHYSCPQLPKYS